MTFNEEEGEDTLVLNAARCFSGTHTVMWDFAKKNISDKRLPREAFSDQGDVEVTKDTVTFNEEEDEDILVEEGPHFERGAVLHKDTCHP